MSASNSVPSRRNSHGLADFSHAALAKQASVFLDSDLLSGDKSHTADRDEVLRQVNLSSRQEEAQIPSATSRTLAHLSTRSTLDHELADAIISEGYDAVGDNLVWDQLAGKIAKIFGGEQAFFLAADNNQPDGYKIIGASLEDRQQALPYLEEVRRFEQQRTRPTDRPSPFLAFPYLERISTFAFAAEDPYAVEKRGTQSNKKRHCLFPLSNRDDSGLFILIRPMVLGDLANSELDLLQHVLPHLSRAVGLHEQTTHLTQKNTRLEEVLDSLPHGLALSDKEGQLLYANRHAKACLEERAGLFQNNGQLCATNSQDNKLLKQKLASIAATGVSNSELGEREETQEDSTQLTCEIEDSHLVVDLSPLTACMNSQSNSPLVRLLLRDSREHKGPTPESLKKAFSLTPTEAAVALLLGQGNSAEDVAALRSITKETARYYIKAILQKMDCHRQPQLVHKLANLAI